MLPTTAEVLRLYIKDTNSSERFWVATSCIDRRLKTSLLQPLRQRRQLTVTEQWWWIEPTTNTETHSTCTSRCNSGQVVHTCVPLFTKQYKLVPTSAGGKVHHRSGVGYAGSHSVDLAVGGQPAPLQHHSYLWLPLYSGLDVTSVTYAAYTFLHINNSQLLSWVIIINSSEGCSLLAAYRWASGSGWSAWSKDRRPLALFLQSPRELSQCCKYGDSTINIVQVYFF